MFEGKEMIHGKSELMEVIKRVCVSEGNGSYRSPLGERILIASEAQDQDKLQGLNPTSLIIDDKCLVNLKYVSDDGVIYDSEDEEVDVVVR